MFLRRLLSIWIAISFLATSVILPQKSYAQSILNLPEPGTMVFLSSAYTPVLIKGLKINPHNPLALDFIVATGNSRLTAQDPRLKRESEKLIKYFFAALTLPEKDVWVNLSPYEKGRIIPKATGETEMGRDMLAQDYILKQITASLIYPEKGLGKDFWNRIYSESYRRFGTTQIPVNTFNKVWIVADKASVYEARDTVFVVDSHLKVMLDEDYLALEKHTAAGPESGTHALGNQIVREIVLPALEKEVNEGRNFANLRQIFHSLILAKWYKETLKTALLNQVYSNKNKVAGVDVSDKNIQEKIYQQYLKAYKKGVFNYIKQDIDQTTRQPIPRKYFSGGLELLKGLKLKHEAKDSAALSRALRSGTLGKLLFVDIFAATAQKKDSAMSVGTTPQLGMAPEELAVELQKEINEPGSGRIPVIVTISDEHGTVDKFDRLLVDAMRLVPAGKEIPSDFVLDPDKSLARQGINLENFKGQLFIHNIGDFMDRGPFGVKVFLRSKELIDGGLSDFIIGNHDQWMFMNLIGMHLPYYENFNFYGYYDDYDKTEGKVQDILQEQRRINSNIRKAGWWAEKLSEFRKFHEEQQAKKWALVDEEVNGPNGLFSKVTEGMSEDQKKEWYSTPEGQIWNKFRGFDPNVGEVATGVKAVGLVSIVWWVKLLKDFKLIYYKDLNGEHKIVRDTVNEQAWATAINIMEGEIIPALRKTLLAHIDPADGQEPQWWWRIFEAIDFKNYTSPEWWAMDWAYHKGWGPTVFKEINDAYHGGQKAVTAANYLDEDSSLKGVEVLKAIAQFYKDHYTLHIRDVMQIDLMHAFLPIDQTTGEFYFNYRSQKYRGTGTAARTLPYWEGLNAIAEDIRKAPNNQALIRIIYEANTVVNDWYADNTTQAKVSHVADAFTKIGVKKIAVANGIHWLITGHLPMHDFLKLTEDRRRIVTGHIISSEDGQRAFAFSDGGMGERFGGGGKYLEAGPGGFKLRGFPSKNSVEIVDNPQTIILKTDKTSGQETEKVVYKNDNPIPSDIFLPGVLESIHSAQSGNTMKKDEAMVSNPGGIDLNASRFDLQKSGSGIDIKFDPVMIEQLREGQFNGIVPVITGITPIADIYSLLF